MPWRTTPGSGPVGRRSATHYDLVVVTEFPDDETATAVVLQTVAGGNVRTTTMKAFDAEQMSAIIQRTG